MAVNLRKIVDNNGHKIKRLQRVANKIDNLSDKFAAMSDNDLKAETSKLEKYLHDHYDLSNDQDTEKGLNKVLVEAFATVREADRRVLGLYPYKVQLIGGLILHQGNLAEMKTGEGKTLTETLPVYLNALAGKGVHVVTVNSYLSKRDYTEMGEVFRWLGLSVGLNTEDSSLDEKKLAYNCDVTYSTNDELGFDYLRDNMVAYKEAQVQRRLWFCIVDEVDSILIDEARTPLIISASDKSYIDLYKRADKFAKSLNADDYHYDKSTKTISLKEAGTEKANKFFGAKNVYSSDHNDFVLAHYIQEALNANYVMRRDRDYVVQKGKVEIVDSFTGRIMKGRRFSDGLHQALEAKEGVTIQDADRTDATITYQNFFRMYHKLSGMTGTAATDAEEFWQTYHMDVIQVPTNRPVVRKDLPDVIFATSDAKYKAVVEKIKQIHKTGQPILVGTEAVDNSELISSMLDDEGISHMVLNAKNNEKEAAIIAEAGQKNAITIATNMAGRGTDIKLGPGVKELGGLFVLGTDKAESKRIDNQLRGRSGRQGDPGMSQFYLSLEDNLVVRFGDKSMKRVKNNWLKHNMASMPIKGRLVHWHFDNAQRRAEGNTYDERRDTLRYDDVLRRERDKFYSDRQKVLTEHNSFDKYLIAMFTATIDRGINLYSPNPDNHDRDLDDMAAFIEDVFNIDATPDFKQELANSSRKEIKEYLLDRAIKNLRKKESQLIDPEQITELECKIILDCIDDNWVINLDNMEQMRLSITMRGYGERNPLIEYEKESQRFYGAMIVNIWRDITRTFLTTQILN